MRYKGHTEPLNHYEGKKRGDGVMAGPNDRKKCGGRRSDKKWSSFLVALFLSGSGSYYHLFRFSDPVQNRWPTSWQKYWQTSKKSRKTRKGKKGTIKPNNPTCVANAAALSDASMRSLKDSAGRGDAARPSIDRRSWWLWPQLKCRARRCQALARKK